MKKFFKIFFIFLFLLVLVGGISFYFFLKSDFIKKYIKAKLENLLKKETITLKINTIEGNLFDSFKIKTLVCYKNSNFLKVKSIKFKLYPFYLLIQKIKFKYLILDDISIKLNYHNFKSLISHSAIYNKFNIFKNFRCKLFAPDSITYEIENGKASTLHIEVENILNTNQKIKFHFENTLFTLKNRKLQVRAAGVLLNGKIDFIAKFNLILKTFSFNLNTIDVTLPEFLINNLIPSQFTFKKAEIKGLTLNSSGNWKNLPDLKLTGKIKLHVSDFKFKQNKKISGQVNFTSDIKGFNLENCRLIFISNKTNYELKGKITDLYSGNSNFSPNIDFALNQKVNLKNILDFTPPDLREKLSKLNFNGNIDINMKFRGIFPNIKPYAILKLENVSFDMPSLKNELTNITGLVEVSYNSAEIKKLEAKLFNKKVKIKGKIENFTNPFLSIALSINEFISAGKLIKLLPLPYRTILNFYKISGEIKGKCVLKGKLKKPDIKSHIFIKNGKLTYKNFYIKNLSAEAYYIRDEVRVKSADFTVNNIPLKLKGIVNFSNKTKKKFKLCVDISSYTDLKEVYETLQKLELNLSLIEKYFNKGLVKGIIIFNNFKTPYKLFIDMTVKSANLNYSGYKFENLEGRIKFDSKNLAFLNTEAKIFNILIKASGAVYNIFHYPYVDITLKSEKADILNLLELSRINIKNLKIKKGKSDIYIRAKGSTKKLIRFYGKGKVEDILAYIYGKKVKIQYGDIEFEKYSLNLNNISLFIGKSKLQVKGRLNLNKKSPEFDLKIQSDKFTSELIVYFLKKYKFIHTSDFSVKGPLKINLNITSGFNFKQSNIFLKGVFFTYKHFKNIKCYGPVYLNNKTLRFKNIALKFSKNKFKVSGILNWASQILNIKLKSLQFDLKNFLKFIGYAFDVNLQESGKADIEISGKVSNPSIKFSLYTSKFHIKGSYDFNTGLSANFSGKNLELDSLYKIISDKFKFIKPASGKVDITLSFHHHRKLVLNGQITLRNANVFIKQIGEYLSNINGKLVLNKNNVKIEKLSAVFSGSPLKITGSLDNRTLNIGYQYNGNCKNLLKALNVPAILNLSGKAKILGRISGTYSLPIISGRVYLHNGKCYLSFPEFKIIVPYNKSQFDYTYSNNAVEFSKVSINTHKGIVNGQGRIFLNPEFPFEFKINGKNLEIKEFLSRNFKFNNINGRIFVNSSIIRGSIKGLYTLNGNFKIFAKHVRFQGFPMLVKLARLLRIPALANITFDDIEGPVFINNGKLTSPTIKAYSKIMNVDITGELGFDAHIKGKARISVAGEAFDSTNYSIPPDIQQNGVQFKVKFKGTVMKPSLKPDFSLLFLLPVILATRVPFNADVLEFKTNGNNFASASSINIMFKVKNTGNTICSNEQKIKSKVEIYQNGKKIQTNYSELPPGIQIFQGQIYNFIFNIKLPAIPGRYELIGTMEENGNNFGNKGTCLIEVVK